MLVTGPQAAPSYAALGQCPEPGEFPGLITGSPEFTDNNVSVYVGESLTVTGSAKEAEGVIVVEQNATFDLTTDARLFNLGTVGVGSQIAPDPGRVMLHVGGDLDVVSPTSLDVAHGHFGRGGGDVQVGGALTGTGAIETNGGEVRDGLGAPGALAPFGGFGTQVAQTSAAFAELGGDEVDLSGNAATFDGSTPADLHVFTIGADQLNGITTLNFDNFADGAPIVINVTGGPVTLDPNYIAADNVRIDYDGSADFGNWASRILWNFTEATSVQIGDSNVTQFMGSVVAPHADMVLANHMNGRVYAGGNLQFGVAGGTSGFEIHNFPWIGPGPFGCVDGASFTVQKDVVGAAAAQVPADTTFTVHYSYLDQDGVTVGGDLEVPVSQNPVSGPALPAGTEVTVSEIDLPEVPGVSWGEPVFWVDGNELGSPATFEVVDGAVVSLSVVNTANAEAVPAVGGFAVAKSVVGDAAGLVPGDTEFLVDWAAEVPAGVSYDGELSGTVTVLADGTVVEGPQDLPVGTVVTLAERTPLPQVAGVVWGEPELSAGSVTIAEADEPVLVTVTNTANAETVPTVTDGGFAVHKVLDGTASHRVGDDVLFTVTWSAEVPAGAAYDGPTSGQVELRADGTVVTGPTDLPAGTVVTLGEVDLPVIEGVVWGDPSFSVDGETTAELTVVAGQVTDVTLTNTADPSDELVVTGTTAGGLLGVVALLIAGGAALLALAKRRRTA